MEHLKAETLDTIKRGNRSNKTGWMVLVSVLLGAFFALPASLGSREAQDNAGGERSRHVDITFANWETTNPDMAGVVGGDVGTGTFVAEILNFVPGSPITQIEALYHITGGIHSFVAHLFVRQNEVSHNAVIAGEITDGWLKNRHLRGNYMFVSCPNQPDGVCYQGTLHAMVTAHDDAEAQASFENAMSAAPMSIAQDATILDNTTDANGGDIVLQEGTNSWTCFPDNPGSPGNDPACYDAVWMDVLSASMAGEVPTITTPGFAFMLQGGSYASTTDASAMEPAESEEWVSLAPHMMMILPATVDISSFSSDPHSLSPFIMFPGTPLQHLIVPVAERNAADY